MGDKGSDTDYDSIASALSNIQPKESAYQKALAKIATELYQSTSPLRKGLLTQYNQMLTGKYNPRTSPFWASTFSEGKKGIENQYGIAKEQIFSSLPEGGVLQSELAGLEGQRAEQASSLPATISQSIMQDEMNKLYNAAWGSSVSNALGGLGTASNSYTSSQNSLQSLIASTAYQNQAAQNAMYSSIGQGVGTAAALAAFKPSS